MMPSSTYADDFFVANRWILRFAGLWSPETPNVLIQNVYKIYAIAIFLFVNVFFTATEFVSLYNTYGNEYDLIKNISFALTHLMGAIKVVFFYFRGNRFKKIMSVLESEKFRYDSCSNFDAAAISVAYKKMGIRYTLLFFLLAHATLTSSYLPPTFVTISIVYGKNDTGKSLPSKLPYYSWMPFRYDTPRSYLLALGYQAIPMFSYAYSIVGMDTLFMNIMNCIGFNLTVIQRAFLTIRERSIRTIKAPLLSLDGLYDTEEVTYKINMEIKKVIKHLQTIYRVCEDLENLHKYLTLTQVIATIFILCSCLYLVSTTPVNSKQFYAEMVYMVAMGFQLTLYCWFGNEVTLKGTTFYTTILSIYMTINSIIKSRRATIGVAAKLPFYIWQCEWLTATRDLKRGMILTMARARRPLHLTAGNFAPLTLSTFLAIIKGSYSFFAVIKNTSHH